MDSLHIACAIVANCEYFLTTDDQVLKWQNQTGDIKIADPILFIKECEL
jgi:predicted nucleic acid-binding protein